MAEMSHLYTFQYNKKKIFKYVLGIRKIEIKKKMFVKN